MAKKATPKRTVYRDAVDGEFITKKEAEQRPRESIKQKVDAPKPKPKGRGR